MRTRNNDDREPMHSTNDPTRPPTNTPQDYPWPVDVSGHGDQDCDCKCAPPAKEPKKPCVRSKPKDKGCCELILQILDPKNRDREIKAHKPKQSANLKLGNACCDWPIKDSLAPLLVLIYRRAEKGLAPQNEFEKGMYKFVDGLNPARKKALGSAFDAYVKIPDARRCAFETRFDAWPDANPVDPTFVADVLLQEIVALGRFTVFNVSDGKPSAGMRRLWDQSFGAPADGTVRMVTGPWPWICAVNPGADKVKWYRNLDTIVPDKLGPSDLHPNDYEFSVTCTASNDPTAPNGLRVDCPDNVIAPSSGGFGFVSCSGGAKYNINRPNGAPACLKVPVCVAGQGVALQGFNFTSLACKVKVVRVDGPFPDMFLNADVMGNDAATPKASCAVGVDDILTFNVPRDIPDGINRRPVPPGRYSVEVHVPNEDRFAPEAGVAPTEFVSNSVLIDIVPPGDITYQVWTERGFCYEETDGPGDDEPWFVSVTGTYKAVGTQTVDTVNREIFKQEDIDGGDWIGYPRVDVFKGKLEVEGCVGVAILGLEVDSDDAAKDQVTDFWDAYGLYWKQAITLLTSGAAGGALGKGITALAGGSGITPSLVVGGVAIIVIAAAGLLFAAWAPADPIAYDLFVYDAVTLFNLTAPGSALPLQDAGNLAGITWSRTPLSINPTSFTTAEYQERREYRADDEGSHYGLDFHIDRLP